MPSHKNVFFEDLTFRVYPNVYEPAEDSFMLAEKMACRNSDVVLDMGTGCGILGIIAAKDAVEVIAVDINPHAVRLAKINARSNSVHDRMFFVAGDLFASLPPKKEFSLILFNAPYLPCEQTENSWLELAWSGGTTGRVVINRFISQAPKYLDEDGRILLLQSTLSDLQKTLQQFEGEGFRTNIIARKALSFFEEIILIRAEMKL